MMYTRFKYGSIRTGRGYVHIPDNNNVPQRRYFEMWTTFGPYPTVTLKVFHHGANCSWEATQFDSLNHNNVYLSCVIWGDPAILPPRCREITHGDLNDRARQYLNKINLHIWS